MTKCEQEPRPLTARMVPRIQKELNDQGQMVLVNGQAYAKPGRFFQRSQCGFCGHAVCDRTNIGNNESPSACEICRDKDRKGKWKQSK